MNTIDFLPSQTLLHPSYKEQWSSSVSTPTSIEGHIAEQCQEVQQFHCWGQQHHKSTRLYGCRGEHTGLALPTLLWCQIHSGLLQSFSLPSTKNIENEIKILTSPGTLTTYFGILMVKLPQPCFKNRQERLSLAFSISQGTMSNSYLQTIFKWQKKKHLLLFYEQSPPLAKEAWGGSMITSSLTFTKSRTIVNCPAIPHNMHVVVRQKNEPPHNQVISCENSWLAGYGLVTHKESKVWDTIQYKRLLSLKYPCIMDDQFDGELNSYWSEIRPRLEGRLFTRWNP